MFTKNPFRSLASRFLVSIILATVFTMALPADEVRAPEMVRIPGGSFSMGSPLSDPDNHLNELQHRVSVDGFSLSRTELTRGEFREFITATAYKTSAELGDGAWWYSIDEWIADPGHGWRNPGFPQTDRDPVCCVSWLDAIAYCNWLSARSGLKPVYRFKGNADFRTWPSGWNLGYGEEISWDRKANGYRLPSEAEWEFAARGGPLDYSHLYAGSDQIDDVAWYRRNAGNVTHPVGLKAANSLGLVDLSGNVAEWCWDWFGPYDTGLSRNPTGPRDGLFRVMRGGAYFSGYEFILRAAYRCDSTAEYSSVLVGFRLARNADAAP